MAKVQFTTNLRMMSEPTSFTLLLAEDDEDIAFLFRRMFRSFEPQWRLEWRRDGLAAIDFCMKSGLPDVLVTDLNMPDMNGYEVIAWMRAQPARRRVPVVVYSSSDDETTREICREVGASEFISKAIQPSRLQELMRRILVSSPEAPLRRSSGFGYEGYGPGNRPRLSGWQSGRTDAGRQARPSANGERPWHPRHRLPG